MTTFFLSSLLFVSQPLLVVPARLSTSPPLLLLPLQLLLLFPLMAHMDIEFSFLLLLPEYVMQQRKGEMQSRIEVKAAAAAAEVVNRSTSGCLCLARSLLLLGLVESFPDKRNSKQQERRGERERKVRKVRKAEFTRPSKRSVSLFCLTIASSIIRKVKITETQSSAASVTVNKNNHNSSRLLVMREHQ